MYEILKNGTPILGVFETKNGAERVLNMIVRNVNIENKRRQRRSKEINTAKYELKERVKCNGGN